VITDPQATIAAARFDAVVFDMDGVVTQTATVHAAAWKALFDAFLEERALPTDEPFRPFDIEADYLPYVDGKARYDGVRDFLASRGVTLPWGAPSDLPDARFQITLQQILKAGGDFYDVIPVGPGVYDYVVADTAGHDLAASFWTAALKTLLAQYASAANSPIEILRSINNTLRRVLPEGVFFTVCYTRVNRKMNRLWIASAGHPPAFLFSRNEPEPAVFAQQADVLGAFEDAVFDAVEHKIRPGDRFFLCSDGLIELSADHESGFRQLTQACAAFRDIPLADAIPGIVRQLTAGAAPKDDILLMGVEI